jgi:glycosyltransferase involved in cell wall biosynthesis
MIEDNNMPSPESIRTDRAEGTGLCPLVTVGIPTYNGAAKIRTAVRSVLDQGYPNLEIFISDNCSGDNTQEICMDLARQHPCIKYFRQPRNMGVMSNFQFVLSHASGDFFMWMSDDDKLDARILPEYVDFLVKNQEYALVSGQIKHWRGNHPLFCERDFNIQHSSRMARMLKFYFTVVYGSIFYGLMPRHIAAQIPLESRIGGDWHFIASLAYLGKIKNLDRAGYHKQCGGISKNFKQYGKVMGATSFATRFPHLQIAMDAFSNILFYSPVYNRRPFAMRIILAVSAFLALFISFYGKRYPLIVGGKIKRALGMKTASSRYGAA